MKNIFVDTNVLIDYSKGFGTKLKPLLSEQKENLVHLYINPIIIIEYMNDYNLTNKEKVLKAKKFFQNFILIDVNKNIAYITANLLRTKQISYIGDALIAATCLENKLELMTNNQKDFKKVRELKFFNIF
ncbi:hypothetical protein CO083_03875 [Candidatus Roizmanbacteria bacterium CG_4_9_14_0_8_um_filter_34_12]|uniref:PIN domain-containing protein n=4 Tax=Candidatus Roizmaniibacteriota TaxID=1752723 RepID=A0A2H0C272_9BACT|nr:MAG: hypothetical protein COW96_04860 [Candidatus Roizmanbacteria bacterium CG22_combo_CG10-13_8_21_14_all_33_16]PIX70189.1 MAG: hypothetical protein COZ39_04765 [Candidatus Roizmanbacteria bacterium CG_4_10_14_3_um_filter_33_21]PJB88034.1 MAG: hypothetical protein CO083_03875 [Candidatus Roizmanbacteria bacterium CG_4_9_14_0_8_um_filter_34_12]PJC81375.1 MAG: hypothetical protein CO007_05030 [Candidatus Roizmanbacteria bacterium CG_4_8_14_3_um_filter_36_10]